jgi:hypothetical protein
MPDVVGDGVSKIGKLLPWPYQSTMLACGSKGKQESEQAKGREGGRGVGGSRYKEGGSRLL